jgi:SAM-dependent methyltransferase
MWALVLVVAFLFSTRSSALTVGISYNEVIGSPAVVEMKGQVLMDNTQWEQKLLDYYLLLKTPIPEGGAEWNVSPEYHYLFGFAVRDFLRRVYPPVQDATVCNIGIGVGDWDDYLGYWLHGWGKLTSVDIDEPICTLFPYRQQRERHPNPSRVVNEDLFQTSLPPNRFDLVTIIGSTPQETGQPQAAIDRCLALVKPGGHVLYMGTTEIAPESWFTEYLTQSISVVTHHERFEHYPEMLGYAYLLQRPLI